jgi:hypothetical protein
MARPVALLLRPRSGRRVRRHPRRGRDRHVRLGVIPVEARVGEVAFTTSLFPKNGGYLLPLKDAVRKPQGLSAGDDVTVEMTVRLESD